VKLSFRARLALQWSLAFGALLAVACVAIYVSIRAFLIADLDANLRTLAATEVASSGDGVRGEPHLHEFTPDPWNTDFSEKFVQLLEMDGRVIMQSPELRDTRPLVRDANLDAASRGATSVLVVSADNRPGRLIALRSKGPKPFIVAVGLFTDRTSTMMAWVGRMLVVVWFASVLVTGAVGYALASRALRPIRRITTQASGIAAGQSAARLDPAAVDDEIGQMTRLLNQMLDRLFGAIEANRRFAADASHELRSPLTAVMGEVDVALKRDREPAEYRQTLTMVQGRLRQMASLTEDLMLLVRAQEGKTGPMVEVAVTPMLEQVAERHAAAAAAHRMRVAIDAPADLVVYGEAPLVERVIDNLVRNAVHYNAEGGAIVMAAALHPRSGEWESDEVVITVRDGGPGIPVAERERVFERFYRLDPSRSRRTGGWGLGLAIARDIVTLFGGRIRVADTPGPGATFEVTLRGGIRA
jgi:two-component system OmpR family sensor kinase